MLTTIDALFKAQLQQPKCADCSADAPTKFSNGRTYVSQRCESCAYRHRLDVVGRSCEKQRRKAGIPQVKGLSVPCRTCAVGVICNRRGGDRYCTECALEASRERARTRSRAKARERGAPQLGATIACSHCKVTFARSYSREKYCAACRDLRVKGHLPSYQSAQKACVKRWLDRQRENPEWRVAEAARLRAKRARRKQNPAFTLNERMSVMVRTSLATGKQGKSWKDLVEFSVVDLERHLERQFVPGMSWDNRSDWHIDHIVPLASFTFKSADDPEFRAAWALTNLRPLWKADNLKKNAQRLFLI
jgi:hypothetical protein